VAEVGTGCSLGMLLCLDRRQRLAFILGDIFGLRSKVGGELMDVSPANFRQMCSRARRDLSQFMSGTCGLMDPGNPCQCRRKTRAFIEAGYVDPANLRFAPEHVRRMREVAERTWQTLETAVESQCVAIFRDHPFYEPPGLDQRVRRLMVSAEVREAFQLDGRA
jgi:hypothetical protein